MKSKYLRDLKPEDDVIVDEVDNIDAISFPTNYPWTDYSCWEEFIYDEISGPLKNILEGLKPESEEFRYLMAWYFHSLDQYPKELNARHKRKLLEAEVDNYQDAIDYRQEKRKDYYKEEEEGKAERNDIVRYIDSELRAITEPGKIHKSVILDKINDALYKAGINNISKATYNRIREKQ